MQQDIPFPTARWITSPVIGGPRTLTPASYFRTTFNLEQAPKSAVLHATALGLYDAEINGSPLGDQVLAPGWTNYRKRVYYQTHDVTPLLSAGENILGFILGDGWYSGHIAEKDRQIYGDRPQLLAQIKITAEDGTLILIGSGTEWQTTTGPILENDLIMGETHDARRELGAWSSPGYDDTTWVGALSAPDPGIVVEPSPGPPISRHELLPGILLNSFFLSWEKKRLLYDFSQNLTGRIRITIRGKRGTHLSIRHAEILDPEGNLYTENLRSARATDYYTLRGEDSETWEPRFTFHGFRYSEISWYGTPEDISVERIEAVVLHSDTPPIGEFSCSNPLLNQLEHNILWGQKGNFLDVPTDCPQRDERLGWTGDAQVFIRTAAFHMDVRGFFHKWLKDMRDAQYPDGSVPGIVPDTSSLVLSGDGGSGWADAALICPWTIYRCYGDLGILADHYGCMAGYMDYLAKNKVLGFIRSHPDLDEWGGFGDWLALDGSGRTEGGTAKDLIGTAFYANNADIMARTSELLGKTSEAADYRRLHADIKAAFQNRFVTSAGLIAGGTQTAHVLALHFDLVPEAVRATTARELVRKIVSNGLRLGTGFLGTPYLLHVLEATGNLETAYQLLEQESFPSWLFPVKNGATTIWERWDGWTPEKGFQTKAMNSFNHYAYGAVGDWMVSTAAGLELDPIVPGYKKILFKPRPGGSLTRADASLLTPQGKAAIAWKLAEGALLIDFTVPEGSSARLSPPSGWKADTTIPADFGPGTHQVKLSKTVEQPD